MLSGTDHHKNQVVQLLYEKIKELDEDFIFLGYAEDERLIKKMNEKGVDSSKDEMIQEEVRRSSGGKAKKEDMTKRMMKLRLYFNYNSCVEEKEVDYVILDRKISYQRMETESLGTKHKLRRFGAVYQLVMDRYQDEMPEGFDRVLWGDLLILFNPDDKDEISYSYAGGEEVSFKKGSTNANAEIKVRVGIRVDQSEQFWTSAKSKTINNVRHITAKVAGKSVSIFEASIRRDLRFDDADRIDTLPNQAIFDAIQQMSSKSTSWDQIPTNIATAVICLTSNQKYNFSKLIFDGKQLVDVSVPLDHFLVNTLTSKVFSFMVKKGKHFSGKVTPLFATMLVQPTQDEGASSERPSEAQPTPSPAPTSEVPYEPQTDSSPAQASEVPIEHQPNPSPRPSPTTSIPAFIPETSGENLGDQAKEIQDLKAQITKLKKKAKPVIKHHKAYLKSVSLKQRFPRKSFSKKHRVLERISHKKAKPNQSQVNSEKKKQRKI
ncbi:hypothetical protein Tco_1049132 [Tanacetum coccineum]